MEMTQCPLRLMQPARRVDCLVGGPRWPCCVLSTTCFGGQLLALAVRSAQRPFVSQIFSKENLRLDGLALQYAACGSLWSTVPWPMRISSVVFLPVGLRPRRRDAPLTRGIGEHCDHGLHLRIFSFICCVSGDWRSPCRISLRYELLKFHGGPALPSSARRD